MLAYCYFIVTTHSLSSTGLDCVWLGNRVQLPWVFPVPIRSWLSDGWSLNCETFVHIKRYSIFEFFTKWLDDYRFQGLLTYFMWNFCAFFTHSRSQHLLDFLELLNFVHMVFYRLLLVRQSHQILCFVYNWFTETLVFRRFSLLCSLDFVLVYLSFFLIQKSELFLYSRRLLSSLQGCSFLFDLKNLAWIDSTLA